MLRARIQRYDGDPRHGSVNGYTNLKCRCPECRAAWAAYVKERKARRMREPIPPNVDHGLATTYSNWGCRCERCRSAWNAYWRHKASRRREREVGATR